MYLADLCSALLAVRRYYAWLSELNLCLRGVQKKKGRLGSKTKLRCLCSLEAIRLVELMMIQQALLQEEHLPSNHVHLAVGTPRCHDLV